MASYTNIFTFQHHPSKNILTGILSAKILPSKWKEFDIKPTQTSPVPSCNLLYCPSFKTVFFLPEHKHVTNRKSYVLKIGKIILVKQKDLSRKVKSKGGCQNSKGMSWPGVPDTNRTEISCSWNEPQALEKDLKGMTGNNSKIIRYEQFCSWLFFYQVCPCPTIQGKYTEHSFGRADMVSSYILHLLKRVKKFLLWITQNC